MAQLYQFFQTKCAPENTFYQNNFNHKHSENYNAIAVTMNIMCVSILQS